MSFVALTGSTACEIQKAWDKECHTHSSTAIRVQLAQQNGIVSRSYWLALALPFARLWAPLPCPGGALALPLARPGGAFAPPLMAPFGSPWLRLWLALALPTNVAHYFFLVARQGCPQMLPTIC